MDNRGQARESEFAGYKAEQPWQTAPAPEIPMSQNQARGIGGRVLTAQNFEREDNDTEQAELARDEAELEHPEEFVGRQTEVQIREGYEAEAENADPKLKFVREAELRGQRGITEAAMGAVDKLAGQSQYRPAEMIDLFNRASADMRRSFPVPEGMGDVA